MQVHMCDQACQGLQTCLVTPEQRSFDDFRMALVDAEFFGPADLTLQQQLDLAFRDFKQFCRLERVACSQPAFTPRLVPRLRCSWGDCSADWLARGLCFCFLELPSMRNVCSKRSMRACAKVIKKDNEILLTAKAYNGRCLLAWLAHALQRASQLPHVVAKDNRISTMYLAMILAHNSYEKALFSRCLIHCCAVCCIA